MEITTETTVVVNLQLNEVEAYWLKGFIQNYPQDAESVEAPRHSAIRKEMFDRLSKALDNK